MATIDTIRYWLEMQNRYRRCFDWFHILSIEVVEWIPPDDVRGMRAEILSFGLPLPTDPDASTLLLEAWGIFEAWQAEHHEEILDAQALLSADYHDRYTQNCPHC